MIKSIEKAFKVLQDKLNHSKDERVSFYTKDPISGNVALHGATNKRPKAYAGDKPKCPWDSKDLKSVIVRSGEAFLVPNDFPAINADSSEYPESKELVDNIYEVSFAKGNCFVAIYTHEHNKKWQELSDDQRLNVINLWAQITELARDNNDIAFTEIFENIGPNNSMTHPHGQQYNLSKIPPKVETEIENSKKYFEKQNSNLFNDILNAELDSEERIIIQNDSFIAFVPPGAEWPFQIRILPKRHWLWLFEMTKPERVDFADILTRIREGLEKFFSKNFKPTIMMTLQQAPFDNDEFYRDIYSFRVEFYNTALSKNAEKLMFSVENSTGLKVYGSSCEEVAAQLRDFIK